MPTRASPPAYRLHKARNCAVVTIHGKNHYLGPYGSPESHEKYARLIAEWRQNGQPTTGTFSVVGHPDFSVNEMLLAFWQAAARIYAKDGKPTKELGCMREAILPLRELYGLSPVSEFGPKALKSVRQHMIDKGLARSLINHRISRIKRVFKWAVAEELISPSIFHSLQAVSGLRFGRSEARETEPIRPVADEAVDAVLPYLTPTVAAMVRLQRLTGMRPGEVCIMRACDIDMTEDVWLFEPHDHKTKWRGHQKLVPLGPQAQAILQPFLGPVAQAYLFSPVESEKWRRDHRATQPDPNRKTPIYPSELRARENAKAARRNRQRKRPHHERYDTASYRKAITYGILKAKKAGAAVEHWHPNQLRHSCGTEVRRKYGIEAAQVVLGHARADVTQVYAEKNLALAKSIALNNG